LLTNGGFRGVTFVILATSCIPRGDFH
jgi:hypothetical protein